MPGAPRNQRTRRAILDAAMALTAELGYERSSIEGIARRAGTSKQTIYRWWPSKAAVLHEAFESVLGDDLAFPDTGDLMADMRTQMTSLARFFTDPAFSSQLRGMLGAAQSNPDANEEFLQSLVRPRIRGAEARITAAQQAGELDPRLDPTLLIDLLYGPVYHRLLITRNPMTVDYVDDVLAAGLAPHIIAAGTRAAPAGEAARA